LLVVDDALDLRQGDLQDELPDTALCLVTTHPENGFDYGAPTKAAEFFGVNIPLVLF
jgi:hypothetical protein